MNYKFRNDTVIIQGDTHEFSINYDTVNLRIPEGSDYISVGDQGLGFGDIRYAIPNTLSWLDRMNKLCKDLDIRCYLLRGNHDATYPAIWNSEWCNVFLIRDSAVGIFPNGKKTLFVGGGLSVDRCNRKENFDYWSDELTPYLEDVEKTDFVFSHDAPEHFNHPTSSLSREYQWAIKEDPALLEESLKQRLNISDIVARSEAKVVIGGHFHNSYREERDGVYYRCLDINELFEFDSNKEYKL